MSTRQRADVQARPDRKHPGIHFGFLLLAGSTVIMPRFFFDIRADMWPGVLLYFGLAGLYLGLSIWLRRSNPNPALWQAAFAIFMFTVATPLANELGRGAGGWFVAETAGPEHSLIVHHLFSTLLPAFAILLLNFLSGARPKILFLTGGRLREGLTIGLIFLAGLSAFSFLSADVLAGREIARSEIVEFLPWLGIGVLLNGFREELWFRGVLLKPFTALLGPGPANLLQALLFALPHFTVDYTSQPFGFMFVTFFGGLLLGFLACRTGSLLAPTLVHSSLDIPIWLGIFANL